MPRFTLTEVLRDAAIIPTLRDLLTVPAPGLGRASPLLPELLRLRTPAIDTETLQQLIDSNAKHLDTQ